MPRIYRAMSRDGVRPRVGSTARTLGVRVPRDIPVDADGNVSPGTGGMSVAPAWRDLPPHRIPRRLRHLAPDAVGNDEDFCWRMGDGPFTGGEVGEGLTLRLDRPTHGLVEPSTREPLERYRDSLAATRDLWIIDEG